MKYFYLPGFSKKNEIELESFVSFFKAKNIDLITHSWRHWEDSNVEWDSEIETMTALRKMNHEDYVLIAKSIGTFIGMKLTSCECFPKMILMGIPYNDLDEIERKVYGHYVGHDIVLYQRKNDSHGSIEDVKKLIPENKVEYVELPGDTHDYNIPELVYNKLIERMWIPN